jgi:hypothetical protein
MRIVSCPLLLPSEMTSKHAACPTLVYAMYRKDSFLLSAFPVFGAAFVYAQD